MDKTFVRVREDGTTYLHNYSKEFEVSGDLVSAFGWKAKAKRMQRAIEVFLACPEMIADAKKALAVQERKGHDIDPWELAGQVNANLPGGLPAFVTDTAPETRRAA